MDRDEVRRVTKVRINLHHTAVFLGTVLDLTADSRASEALDRVCDMRYEYDEAWKAAAEEL